MEINHTAKRGTDFHTPKLTDMKQLMPKSDYGKEEHLYLVPTRNNLSLQKNSTSTIHATRYETTGIDHVLGVHVDIQNPNIHNSLSD